LKWGKPCYSYGGSNILILQPFKAYCALMFCKGALLADGGRLLATPGENTQAARQLRFASVEQITKMEPIVKAYVAEAIGAEKAGLQVSYKETSEFAVPEELQQRFAQTPSFKKAFEALTPGRQRGYLLYFAAAKQSATRGSRIEKNWQRILEGKGLNDR
ncbi:MAG: YdeI/OmpD-associated family protein, partial [Verrucomicrobiota bacterium]|nr:YdeI/OmpD-associated family protein [Verrucomicrobiota bacterium]